MGLITESVGTESLAQPINSAMARLL